MCAYYVTNETQLIKFEKFYNDYINDNNFKAVFISEYNDVYTLFKDEFNEIFTKARIDTTDVLLQNMASNIKETRQRNDAIYVTLREMASNTKETRQWTRFFGIVIISKTKSVFGFE